MPYPRFIGKVDGEFTYLEDEELKHARVRRIKVGYKIEVNDLNGNVYIAQVEEISKKFLKARILNSLTIQDIDIKINLFLAVPNRLSKIDDLIEQISQLGVYSFTPVVVKTSALKEKDVLKKTEKWKKIALNSIKQCERLYPLKINNPITINDIPTSERNFLFYEREDKNTLKNYIGDKAKNINVILGNEGGFSEDEVRYLTQEKGFESVSLGKLILTMETAVIASICQINFVYNC